MPARSQERPGGQYDPRTATVDDGYLDAADAAAVTAAGAQSIKTNGFVTGIEGGYNFQAGRWLLGLEADLEAVHLIGQTNSGGVPYPGAAPLGAKPPGGPAFTVFSSAQSDWLLTARPRLGFVGPNNWLFYATGGLAETRLHSDIFFTDNVFALEAGKVDATKLGYAVGGGIEAPLTNRLSIKADYLHVGFGNTAGASTANNLVPFFPAQVFTHSSDLKADTVRVGLNYYSATPTHSHRAAAARHWITGDGLDHIRRLRPYRRAVREPVVSDGGRYQREQHCREAIRRPVQARRELQVRLRPVDRCGG
jgi:outer membrane immunogenic protein